jgi:hypothetical protein
MSCSRCGYHDDHSAGRPICPVCGTVLSEKTAALTATIYDDIIPWQAPSCAAHPLSALFLTAVRSFTDRGRFFAAAARTTPLTPPLLYGVLMGSIGVLASYFWETMTPLSIRSLFPDSSVFSGVTQPHTPGTLILTPLALFLQIGLLTLYCHGMLMISRSRKKAIAVTAKTICYAQGAALFQLIPFAGIFLSLLAGAFLLIEGLHAAHGISRTRVFLSLATPVIIMVSLIAAVTVLLLSVSALDLFSLLRR